MRQFLFGTGVFNRNQTPKTNGSGTNVSGTRSQKRNPKYKTPLSLWMTFETSLNISYPSLLPQISRNRRSDWLQQHKADCVSPSLIKPPYSEVIDTRALHAAYCLILRKQAPNVRLDHFFRSGWSRLHIIPSAPVVLPHALIGVTVSTDRPRVNMCCERKLKKRKKKKEKAGIFSEMCALTGDVPVKNSPNSCSSFMALSNVFLACSSVSLLFMSLRTGETPNTRAQFIFLHHNSAGLPLAHTNAQHLLTHNIKPTRRAQHVYGVKEYSH